MYSVLAPTLPSQRRSFLATIPGPLSLRIYSGTPRSIITSAKMSMTSWARIRRAGEIVSDYFVYSSSSVSILIGRPSLVRSITKSQLQTWLRDECLNVHWFETMDDAKAKIEAWRVEYNESRPHEALKDLTPSEYAMKCSAIETTEVVQQAEK